MPELDDLDLDLDLDARDFSWLRRVVGGIGRAIGWLLWDFGCEWFAWSVGWFVCRLVTVGRFPHEGLGEEDEAAWWVQFVVIVAGLSTMGVAVWAALELLG